MSVFLWLPLIQYCCYSWWKCTATLPTSEEPSTSMWLCKGLWSCYGQTVVHFSEFSTRGATTLFRFQGVLQLSRDGALPACTDSGRYLSSKHYLLVVVLPVSDSMMLVWQHLNWHGRNVSVDHSRDILMLGLVHCWNQPRCLQLPGEIKWNLRRKFLRNRTVQTVGGRLEFGTSLVTHKHWLFRVFSAPQVNRYYSAKLLND